MKIMHRRAQIVVERHSGKIGRGLARFNAKGKQAEAFFDSLRKPIFSRPDDGSKCQFLENRARVPLLFWYRFDLTLSMFACKNV